MKKSNVRLYRSLFAALLLILVGAAIYIAPRISLPAILLVMFVCLLLVMMIPDRKKITHLVVWLCVIAVFGGFIFYTYGYLYHEAADADLASAVLSATSFGLYNTFRMFHNEHDFDLAIRGQSIWMHFLFWLSHLSAIFAFNIVLLNLFGRKLIIHNILMIFGMHKKVYIIKGNDENALCLGKDLAAYSEREEYDLTLSWFQRNINKAKNLWDSFFKRELIIYWLENDDNESEMYEKAMDFRAIVKVIPDKNSLNNMLKSVGLIHHKTFYSFLKKEKSYKIIFMPNDISISDDVSNLTDLLSENKSAKNLEMYIVTPSQWERDKIKILQKKENCTFHLINEVDLIARKMIEKLPPYACPELKFTDKGTATKDFKVMTIGFGNMGQAALLRLVMNGQFVGSAMQAIVIDEKDDKTIEGRFHQKYPELHRLCCDMTFLKYDVLGREFYEYLDTQRDIDYIVIATNDDEINKQAAMLLKLHYERNEMTPPTIALISNPENRGHVENKDTDSIYIFGSREDVYKEKVIIREEVDRMAKAVDNAYNHSHDYPLNVWETLSWHTQETNRASADFIPTMLFLAGITEEEARNLPPGTPITTDPELAENLAITEHLRWNAFHAATGWKTMSIPKMLKRLQDGKKHKNEDTKEHPTLVRWEELDAVTIARYGENGHNFKDDDREIIKNIPETLRWK